MSSPTTWIGNEVRQRLTAGHAAPIVNAVVQPAAPLPWRFNGETLVLGTNDCAVRVMHRPAENSYRVTFMGQHGNVQSRADIRELGDAIAAAEKWWQRHQ